MRSIKRNRVYKFIDMTKTKKPYGSLTVLERAPSVPGHHGALWLCECACGNRVVKSGHHLRQGFAVSCGCRIGGKTHGCDRVGGRTRAYSVWRNMKNRCLNENVPSYEDYGAKGVKVCERWLDFNNFLADMGEPEPGLTLDRKDYLGDYEPGNCRWLPRADQARNKRDNVNLTIDGRTMTMKEWSRVSGVNYLTIRQRVKTLGWSDRDAVFKPARTRVVDGIPKTP